MMLRTLRRELDLLVSLGFSGVIIRLVFNDGYSMQGCLMRVYRDSEKFHYKLISHADFDDVITLKVHCNFNKGE